MTIRELTAWSQFYAEKAQEQRAAERRARRGRSGSDVTVDPGAMSDDEIKGLF
jgi:hypothetical protein